MYLGRVRLGVLIIKISYVLEAGRKENDIQRAISVNDDSPRAKSWSHVAVIRSWLIGYTVGQYTRGDSYLLEFWSECGGLRTNLQMEPYHRQPRHSFHVVQFTQFSLYRNRQALAACHLSNVLKMDSLENIHHRYVTYNLWRKITTTFTRQPQTGLVTPVATFTWPAENRFNHSRSNYMPYKELRCNCTS